VPDASFPFGETKTAASLTQVLVAGGSVEVHPPLPPVPLVEPPSTGRQVARSSQVTSVEPQDHPTAAIQPTVTPVKDSHFNFRMTISSL